ncbi:hypothetical protein BZA70DRAFT_265101 [Myxozyma melibiosi]|uniref:SEC7 domain-containing protein n=1 Tax=Myxozyma melibiosi TaxID=54550 RepID=A0ABR1FD26_9ASCO
MASTDSQEPSPEQLQDETPDLAQQPQPEQEPSDTVPIEPDTEAGVSETTPSADDAVADAAAEPAPEAAASDNAALPPASEEQSQPASDEQPAPDSSAAQPIAPVSPSSASIASTATATTSHGIPASSMRFVAKAFESILNTRDGKRKGPLQIGLQNGIDQLTRLAPATPHPSVIFEPLRLASAANNNDIRVIALDTWAKLFSFSYLSDVPMTEPAPADVDDAIAPVPAPRTGKLIDQAVEVVCDCFTGDNTDERVELQIIKALMAAVLNEKLVVHGAALLKAIRQTYNIFILSRSNANQAVAQATLTQMVNVIFDRVKSRVKEHKSVLAGDDVAVEIPQGPPVDVNLEEKLNQEEVDEIGDDATVTAEKDNSDAIDEKSADDGEKAAQPKITLESFENRQSFDQERAVETAANFPQHENELYVRDAFLVFRALCKLSIKAVDTAENKPDMRSHAMRSKLLSLHLVSTILSQHMVVFQSPDVIIRSSASSEETLFIHAIKQYLCLCLSRNAANPVPAIFEVSCDIFWMILLNLRSQMKKEIEVFMTEIYLPILEMKTSTAHQKQYLLRGLAKIAGDPRALVEIYLNYDCDNTALDNIYERLVDYLARISIVPVSLTPFQQQQYNDLQKTAPTSAFGSSTGPGGVAIPPSFSSSAVQTIQTTAQAELLSQVPLEYILKREALECLVTMLRSLVSWATTGIDQEKSKARGDDDDDSESIADEDGRSGLSSANGAATPSSSTLALPSSNGVNGSSTNGSTTPIDDPSQFESLKHRKTALLEAIKQFNFKPKRGIKMLIDNKFIPSHEPKDIAYFLLHTEGLDKAMVGEYLGEGDPENVAIMHAFVDLMDFTDMKFVEALRTFLQAFRLPGESQKIDRFMLKFAERYISGNPQIFANADTAYVLAYSVIMLNTDQHSPQVKQRMAKTDFFKNNRGINNNEDLPEAFLSEIYDEIQTNEIILKSEHDAALMSGQVPTAAPNNSIAANLGQVLLTVGRDLQREAYITASKEMASKTEQLFKNLVRSQRKDTGAAPPVIFYHASRFEHIGPMFEVVWMSLLACLSATMQESEEPEVIKSCLEGMGLAIKIACLFDIELARISFLTALAKYTNLQNLSEMRPKNVEGIRVLLEVALSDGDLLKESWKDVLTCVSQLERFQLIGSGISEGVVPDLSLAKRTPRESFESQRSKNSVALSNNRRQSSNLTQFSASVAEEANGREIVVAMDKIFTQSSRLSGEAIVYFVRALTEVSREEIASSGNSAHPRMFSLQKMVDVSYYNMDRIRFEWSNLWAIMGEQFNQIGCHPNSTVVFFALDSLRQLSMRFLELEELPHFKFQKDFLRPFEHVMSYNNSPAAKDMVLRCLQQMVLSRADKIRSGWSTMFGVFTFAAKEEYEPVVQFSFENIKAIHEQDFDLVMAQGSFADLAVTLTELAKNYRFQKISLHAIELLRSSIPKMLAYQRSVQEGTSTLSHATKASIEDPSVKFWFPILFAFHNIIMTGEDLEVRSRALNYFFDALVEYGGNFAPDFWDLVCRQLLFPIFIVLKSRSDMSRFNNHEDMSVWLSTTMIQALRNLISLLTHYFDQLERMLDMFLDLLVTCICQENDTLARIGSSCLQTLITKNVTKLKKEHWSKIVGAFVKLFETTTAYQLFTSEGFEAPVTPPSEDDSEHEKKNGLKINGLAFAMEAAEEFDRQNERLAFESSAPSSPVPTSNETNGHQRRHSLLTDNTRREPMVVSPEKRKEFNKIIVKCVLQLLIINTVAELFSENDDVYNNIPSEELLELMRVLKRSFRFARKFNENRELRMKLWREGFMKQPPNLLRQESDAASTYIHILLRMYHDPNQDRVENKTGIEAALIPLCVDIVKGYTLLDEETEQRNIAAWRPVVVEVLDGYMEFTDEDFARHAEVFYPLGVDLLGREPGPEVRPTVQALFKRIGTVWMKGKRKAEY